MAFANGFANQIQTLAFRTAKNPPLLQGGFFRFVASFPRVPIEAEWRLGSLLVGRCDG